MTNSTLTQLVPVAARQAREQLLAALGSEANPSQWMLFMEAVTQLLPDVLSPGRPTKEAISRCAIGQLGFSSWQEMVDAPLEAGGLGWNYSGWKAWRRAWSVVEANRWLRSQALTSSEINSLAMDCRKIEQAIPGSMEALEAFRADQKRSTEQKKGSELADLAEQLVAADRRATAAESEASALRGLLEQAHAQTAALAEQIGTLKAELGKASPAAQPLTRWQHLAAALKIGK